MVLVERYEAPFMRKARRIISTPLMRKNWSRTLSQKSIHADKFEPQQTTFSSWAYRILMNTAFTRYQKLIKDGQRFTSLDPEFEQYIGEQAEHSAFETKRDAIERILNRLPEHFRTVLRLQFLERWPQEDIATELGENVGTIKARVHRAKAAFRKEAKGKERDLLS